MAFTDLDLAFHDYHTATLYRENDPRVSGAPDSTPFDRTEQAELLYFINYCYRTWNWPQYTKVPGRRLERLIRTYLPGAGWTQRDVLEWIRDSWKHYWHLLPGK